MKTKLFIPFFFALLASISINAQWYTQSSGVPSTIPLSSIHCVDADNCFVCGTTITVRKTNNGGTNWNPMSSPGPNSKALVKMRSKDTVLLGQINGTFRKTTNAGSNWSSDISASPNTFTIYDVFYHNSNDFIAVGGNPNDHITGGYSTATSTNKGVSWNYVSVGSQPPMFGLHCLTTTTCVACAGAETVYRTTDGGANWSAVFTGATPSVSLFDIHFPTPTIGYAVGGNATTGTGGIVYKTINAGLNWAASGTGLLPNALYGVHFVSQDTGYVVGKGGKIQVTTDAGATWSAQISPVTTDLNKIYFPNDTVGYIAGANGVILKTINGGFIDPLIINAGSDRSICIGSCTTLGGSPTATGGITPYTYSWSPNSSTTASPVVCPTVHTTYTLIVTDAIGITAIDSVAVMINQLPVVSFSGLSSGGHCNNVPPVPLTGNPSGGTFSGTGISGNTFDPAVAGTGTYSITYTYTDVNGCTNASTQSVTVFPLPSAVPLCLVTVDSVNSDKNILVWEKPVGAHIDSFKIYRLIAASPYLIATRSASLASQFVDNTNGVNPKTSPYQYAMSVVDSCGYESAKSPYHLTIYLLPPVFTTPANTFSLMWTDFLGFTFTEYEVWRGVSGVWSRIGTVPSTAPKQYTDNSAPGNARYRIQVAHSTGCTVDTVPAFTFMSSMSNTTNDYTSISELDLDNWLSVYPNPNHGTFTVQMSGVRYQSLDIKLYNMLGDLMYETHVKNQSVEIVIPEIPSGIYHLQVITDKGTANKKITIQ